MKYSYPHITIFSILIALIFSTETPILSDIVPILYFCLLPGIAISRIVLSPERDLGIFAVCSVTFSVLFMMVAGLTVWFSTDYVFLSLLIGSWLLTSISIYIKGPLEIPDLPDRTIYDLIPPAILISLVMGELTLRWGGTNMSIGLAIALTTISIILIILLDPDINYPLAVFLISIGLALMHGLRVPTISSNGDISFEYFLLTDIINSGSWRPFFDSGEFWSRFSSLPSVTALPYSIYLLIGDKTVVFNIIYRIFSALIPVTIYYLLRHQFDQRIAFSAAIIVPFQFVYITLIGTIARMNISFLFYMVFLYITFTLKLKKETAAAYLLMFGLVLSHYSTAIILLIIMSMYFCSRFLLSRITYVSIDEYNIFNMRSIILLSLMIFFWYGMAIPFVFGDIVTSIAILISSLTKFTFVSLTNTGASSGRSHIAYSITRWFYFGFIGLSGIWLVTSFYTNKMRKISNIQIMTFITLSLVGIMFILEDIYGGYGPYRLFFQLIPFISISAVLCSRNLGNGSHSILISSSLSKKQLSTLFIMVLVVSQILAGPYLILQLYGIPHAEYLNEGGERYKTSVTQLEESNSASWICQYSTDRAISADYFGEHIVSQCDPMKAQDGLAYQTSNVNDSAYVYLRCDNTIFNSLNTKYKGRISLNSIDGLLNKRGKILDNGCSEIYSI